MTPDWDMFWDGIGYLMVAVAIMVIVGIVEGAVCDYKNRYPENSGWGLWLFAFLAVAYVAWYF